MINPNLYFNAYVQILDKNSNIIASGKCSTVKPDFIKENILYISFDDKWFYSNKNCTFNIVEYADTIIPDEPPSFLIWKYWRERYTLKSTVDVYRDFSYDEIDPPIKPYIDKLNNISPYLKTVESCCGHNVAEWYIVFLFLDLNILNMFLKALEFLEGNLILGSKYSVFQNNKDGVMLELRPSVNYCSKYGNDSELKLLDKFTKRLIRMLELEE